MAKALLPLLFRFYPAHLVSLLRVGCQFSILLSCLLGGLLAVLSCLVGLRFVLVVAPIVLSLLVFLFVCSCFPLLFVLGCWLSALLPGPFVPSDSAPPVWWGVTRFGFSLWLFYFLPPSLTCPLVLSGPSLACLCTLPWASLSSLCVLYC